MRGTITLINLVRMTFKNFHVMKIRLITVVSYFISGIKYAIKMECGKLINLLLFQSNVIHIL